MSDEITEEAPAIADEDTPAMSQLDRIERELAVLREQNVMLLQTVGKVAVGVDWLGNTISGLLATAQQMGGPGGKLMSMMLGGGKNNA